MFNESCRRAPQVRGRVRRKDAIDVCKRIRAHRIVCSEWKRRTTGQHPSRRGLFLVFSLFPWVFFFHIYVAAFIIHKKSRQTELTCLLDARRSSIPCFMHNAKYKSNSVQPAHSTLTPYVSCAVYRSFDVVTIVDAINGSSKAKGRKVSAARRPRDEFESLVNFCERLSVLINHQTKNMNIYIMGDGEDEEYK